MRRLALGSPIGSDINSQMAWAQQALRQVEMASHEEPIEVVDSFEFTGTPTITRNLNVSAPSTANLAAVLATLILDFQRRGTTRE